MKTLHRHLALIAVALGGASGCIAYNEQCQGMVENPKELIGYTSEVIYLDKPNARHRNNAVGQMVADAFVDAFRDSSNPPAFGVVNGGGIRAEGLCVARNVLKPGPMTNGLLHEILLFENLVKAVDLTELEIMKMMEHSVDRLFPAGSTISLPTGQFLHVSREVEMAVDCSQPVGERVRLLKVGGSLLPSGNPAKKYRVALSAFLLGGDGYDMLVVPGSDPNRDPVQAQQLGGTDGNIAADYMKRTYNKDLASGLKVDEARIRLTNCAVPPAPSG